MIQTDWKAKQIGRFARAKGTNTQKQTKKTTQVDIAVLEKYMNQSYKLLSSPGLISSGNTYTQSHFSCAQVNGQRNTKEHPGTAPNTVTSLPNRQCPEQGLFFIDWSLPQCGASVWCLSNCPIWLSTHLPV